MRRLAKECGYSHIQRVLVSPWWAAEQVVASALGLKPEQIWPNRYTQPRDRAQRMTRNPAAAKLTKPARKPRAAKAQNLDCVEAA